MIKKVFACLFVFQLITTKGIAPIKIEIFDVSQGEVIKVISKNPDVQQEAEKFLKHITGVYVKYNPIPTKGFMVRIPLEPNITVRNQWFDDPVDEVTIIFPGYDNPYLMIFNDENTPYFFTFEGDVGELLAMINFMP